MKLNKIATLCRIKKKVVLFDAPVPGEGGVYQWISDGVAAYPLRGLPRIDSGAILTILNVAEKDRKDWTVKEMPLPVGLDIGDGPSDEPFARSAMFLFVLKGCDIQLVASPHGALLLDAAYLDPLTDAPSLRTLHIRGSEDFGEYLAVKVGFMLEAIILPSSHLLTEEAVSEIGMFASFIKEFYQYNETKKQLKAARTAGSTDEPDQIAMDTGEIAPPVSDDKDKPEKTKRRKEKKS
jgi:hypothetical protein